MKRTNIILGISVFIIVIITLGYYFYQDDLQDNGKLYPSKENLCTHFAQSYLRTVRKTDGATENEKWQMAVDVETDLYNLCLLKLDREELRNYRSTIIERYR